MKPIHIVGLCLAAFAAMAQEPVQIDNGGAIFQSSCAGCHGADGGGSDRGPALAGFLRANADPAVTSVVRDGRGGMPAHPLAADKLTDLMVYLRALTARGAATEPRKATVRLVDGRTLEGIVRNETAFDMHLTTADQKLHLLVREGSAYRERAGTNTNWTSYDGGPTGNRHSTLDQINAGNVKSLGAAWFFPMPGTPRIESTPVVIDGIMYVTAVNEAYALDAASGRQIWRFREPRTQGILGEAAGGANRGVAVAGNRIFMVTDNARLWALDRFTGRKLWEKDMAEHITGPMKLQYTATGAPMVIGDLVVAGIAGGEEGVRGFLDAYHASTGERAWRFYTIPKRGETVTNGKPSDKLLETWQGNALENGCGATWLTGSYDAALDLAYWAVGNPCPDYNGDQRKGDNLYTGSVVALRPKTGELVWYYQFTPHDTHDWDATEPMLLVDEQWQGRARKLLLHADRNGYFFVLDRTNGELLRATPFLSKVTWTTGYGKDGRPIPVPNQEPTLEGTLTCPATSGGTNWMAAAYHPGTKLYYFQANETCSVYRKSNEPFQVGKRFFGGGGSGLPGSRSYLRAFNVATGKTAWEYELLSRTQSGALSTGGNLVFFGDGGGEFTAVDAKTGARLWHFNAGQQWRSSPMTYQVAGKQYVAIGGPVGFFAFALP